MKHGHGAPLLGQRERNKVDKLQRIREAARLLFVEKGFDETTTREIAVKAGVGIGTIFIYAANKRDLLFLVANDELDAVTQRAEAAISKQASCLENLLTVFRQHYAFFSKQPDISRFLLREMTFYDSGQQARRFQETRERTIRIVQRILSMAAESQSIRIEDEPELAGWVAFCVFQVELRRWLTTRDQSVAAGMKQLERALRLCMTGWNPKPQALKKAAGVRRAG